MYQVFVWYQQVLGWWRQLGSRHCWRFVESPAWRTDSFGLVCLTWPSLRVNQGSKYTSQVRRFVDNRSIVNFMSPGKWTQIFRKGRKTSRSKRIGNAFLTSPYSTNWRIRAVIEPLPGGENSNTTKFGLNELTSTWCRVLSVSRDNFEPTICLRWHNIHWRSTTN